MSGMGGAYSTKAREENVYSLNAKSLCFITTLIRAFKVLIHIFNFCSVLLSVRHMRDTVELSVPGGMSRKPWIMASLVGEGCYSECG